MSDSSEVNVNVSEPLVVVFVSVFFRPWHSDNPDPGFAVLGVKNHRAYEVRIERNLKNDWEGCCRDDLADDCI